jgi:hypothetical protein
MALNVFRHYNDPLQSALDWIGNMPSTSSFLFTLAISKTIVRRNQFTAIRTNDAEDALRPLKIFKIDQLPLAPTFKVHQAVFASIPQM